MLAGRLSECVQQEASVAQALISFLHLGKNSGDEMQSPSCVHVAQRIGTCPDSDGHFLPRHQACDVCLILDIQRMTI